ncbi:MAG: hypothetical protein ABW003_15080 [Microvirga sp.]
MPDVKDDREWLAWAKAQEAKNAEEIERLSREISKLTMQLVSVKKTLSSGEAPEAERLTKEISKLKMQRIKLDNENTGFSFSIPACERHLKKQQEQ